MLSDQHHYVLLKLALRAEYHAHLILHDFITPLVLAEWYKLQRPSLRSFIQTHVGIIL
jgi:hypothetical protein